MKKTLPFELKLSLGEKVRELYDKTPMTMKDIANSCGLSTTSAYRYMDIYSSNKGIGKVRRKYQSNYFEIIDSNRKQVRYYEFPQDKPVILINEPQEKVISLNNRSPRKSLDNEVQTPNNLVLSHLEDYNPRKPSIFSKVINYTKKAAVILFAATTIYFALPNFNTNYALAQDNSNTNTSQTTENLKQPPKVSLKKGFWKKTAIEQGFSGIYFALGGNPRNMKSLKEFAEEVHQLNPKMKYKDINHWATDELVLPEKYAEAIQHPKHVHRTSVRKITQKRKSFSNLPSSGLEQQIRELSGIDSGVSNDYINGTLADLETGYKKPASSLAGIITETYFSIRGGNAKTSSAPVSLEISDSQRQEVLETLKHGVIAASSRFIESADSFGKGSAEITYSKLPEQKSSERETSPTVNPPQLPSDFPSSGLNIPDTKKDNANTTLPETKKDDSDVINPGKVELPDKPQHDVKYVPVPSEENQKPASSSLESFLMAEISRYAIIGYTKE